MFELQTQQLYNKLVYKILILDKHVSYIIIAAICYNLDTLSLKLGNVCALIVELKVSSYIIDWA